MTLVSFSLSLSLADRSGKIDGDAVKSVSMALDRWKSRMEAENAIKSRREF